MFKLIMHMKAILIFYMCVHFSFPKTLFEVFCSCLYRFFALLYYSFFSTQKAQSQNTKIPCAIVYVDLYVQVMENLFNFSCFLVESLEKLIIIIHQHHIFAGIHVDQLESI